MKTFDFHRSLVVVAFILVPLLGTLGCVRRRFTIISDPPGAVAYLDNVELGKTPISRNFMYYGNRELRLVKPGYQTHTQMIALKAPWYQWPGVDFFSEVLVPGELTDHPTFKVTMQQQGMVSHDTLIAHAEQLKALAHSNGAYRIDSGGQAIDMGENVDSDGDPLDSPAPTPEGFPEKLPEETVPPTPNPGPIDVSPAPWDPPNPTLQSQPPASPSPYDPYIPNSLRSRPEQQLYPQHLDSAAFPN